MPRGLIPLPASTAFPSSPIIFPLPLAHRKSCLFSSCASSRLSKDTPLLHFLPHTFLTSQELAFNNGHYLNYCFKCLHLWGTLTSASEQVVFPVKNKMKIKNKIVFSLLSFHCYAIFLKKKKTGYFHSFTWARISHPLLNTLQYGFCLARILVIFNFIKWILRMTAKLCSMRLLSKINIQIKPLQT